jgi:hypothetical protein
MVTPTPQQEACGHQRNTKQRSYQIDEVSDAGGLPPAEIRQNRKFLENVRQGHDPEAPNPQGLQR